MLKIKNKCVNTIIIINSSQGVEHKYRMSNGMTIQSLLLQYIHNYKMFMIASLFVL